MGESDDSLPRGEFNAAMDGMRREMHSLGKQLLSIQTLLENQTRDKIQEARDSGIAEAHLVELSKRMDAMANRVWYVALGLAGQFLWSFFGQKGSH